MNLIYDLYKQYDKRYLPGLKGFLIVYLTRLGLYF